MSSRAVFIAVLAGLASARFGQEQIPIQAISDVQGGAPGAAATIAGAAVSDLLGAANACDKLARGDQILAQLGTGSDAVAAAIGMVAAEKNFNNFAASNPTICSDSSLPSSAVLRGITPLIDPGVTGADVANALSAKTKAAPLNADGMSVADLLTANGFTNFTSQNSSGSAVVAADPGASDAQAASGNTAGSAEAGAAASNSTADAGNAGAGAASNSTAAASGASNSTSAGTTDTGAAGATNANGVQQSTISGLDFGLCVPTIKFEGGLGGRPATEFTFQMIDPLAAKGQEEALNPNIITNRMCDQLTNVCEANDAAKSACASAKTAIAALGTKDKSTADAWNTMLGFAGTVTNPDGGAAEPPASTASKVRRARQYRKARRAFDSRFDQF